MKKCVVSFADGTGDYQRKMSRLEKSLAGNFDGDFIGFTRYEDIECEPHSVIPYKFKPCAIAKAQEMGYELILWCDAPIVAVKSIEPVFGYIKDRYYMFFDNIGHTLGMWTNDTCLQYFGKTRQECMQIKMIMACCMGFNFVWPTPANGRDIRKVFALYKHLADGLYPGSWDNHRHDQTVMSYLINEHKLDILTGQDTFFAYEAHHGVLPIADSVCLISK